MLFFIILFGFAENLNSIPNDDSKFTKQNKHKPAG